MTDNLILYVKSEKLSIVQYQQTLPGHPCTGDYVETQSLQNYKQQDKEAIELLQEAGIPYQLVDLTNCSFTMQIKAKIIGVNETPTLLLNGRKIKGSQSIKRALSEIKVG